LLLFKTLLCFFSFFLLLMFFLHMRLYQPADLESARFHMEPVFSVATTLRCLNYYNFQIFHTKCKEISLMKMTLINQNLIDQRYQNFCRQIFVKFQCFLKHNCFENKSIKQMFWNLSPTNSLYSNPISKTTLIVQIILCFNNMTKAPPKNIRGTNLDGP